MDNSWKLTVACGVKRSHSASHDAAQMAMSEMFASWNPHAFGSIKRQKIFTLNQLQDFYRYREGLLTVLIVLNLLYKFSANSPYNPLFTVMDSEAPTSSPSNIHEQNEVVESTHFDQLTKDQGIIVEEEIPLVDYVSDLSVQYEGVSGPSRISTTTKGEEAKVEVCSH
jgi:hypothetical protein